MINISINDPLILPKYVNTMCKTVVSMDRAQHIPLCHSLRQVKLPMGPVDLTKFLLIRICNYFKKKRKNSESPATRRRQHPQLADIRPGASLSWEFSVECGMCKIWPSMVILNSNLLHGTVHHPTIFKSLRTSDAYIVSELTIIGSDNGLSPGRRQAIIWANAGILLIGP